MNVRSAFYFNAVEQSLHTSETTSVTPAPKSPSPSPSRLGNSDTPHIEPIGVKTTPERPHNLKSDQFIEDAGLSRTGNVPRKSTMERLLGMQFSQQFNNKSL